MAKQPQAPTGNQAHKLGYTTFSSSQFDANRTINAKATDLFLQMLSVPKKIQKKMAKNKNKSFNVSDNDYYPTSKAETQQMDDLWNQSYAAIEDNSDTQLIDALHEMRDILDWSNTRQWNFQWALILGVFLFVCFLWYQTSDKADDVTRAKSEHASVEAKEVNDVFFVAEKQKLITRDSSNVARYTTSIANYEASLDTATTRDNKKYYKNQIKKYKEYLEESENQLAELRSADAKGIKKIVVKDYKQRLSSAKADHRGMFLWTIFFLLLIPLYIVAERPYGYTISKFRLESKVLAWIRKIMFWLAGGLLGGAAALQVTETVTTWSDGSKTTDSDAIPILAMKVCLLIAAACVFVFTSVALILYSTITGLIRNYELKAEAQKLIAKFKK